MSTRPLVVFDLDGTLLPGTTACQEIARVAGNPGLIDTLEALYNDGVITSGEFGKRAAEDWLKHGPALYRRAFQQAPKLDDIDAALSRLKGLGAVTALVTMAPQPFANHFTGFDHVFGSSYGEVILNPDDKPKRVTELLATYGLAADDVIALGDSASDIPLFTVCSRTVAVNASADLRSIARWTYDGPSALEAVSVALHGEVDA